MKTLLFLALALLPVVPSARGDVPPPSPTIFRLAKVTSFPKYHFFYTTEPSAKLKEMTPIAEGTEYRAERDVLLFVQAENGLLQQFTTLKYEYRGKRFELELLDVGFKGLLTKTLKVDFDLKTSQPPPPKWQPHGPVKPPSEKTAPPGKAAPTADQPGPLPHFALAGLSLGALIVIRVKKKALLLAAALALTIPGVRAADGDWASGVALPTGEKAVPLFDGRDLAGWEGQTEKYWSVEDGTIKGANKEGTAASTYLFTKGSYRNFRLLLEVKQSRGPGFSTMHSAVAALGEKFTDNGDPFGFKGPLLMFCADWGIWDAHGRNRVFPPDQQGPMQHLAERVGDWNRIEILVLGDRIRMAANGILVMDFTDKSGVLKVSPIGLQLHYNTQPQEWHFRGLILGEQPEDKMLTLAAPKD